MKKTYQNSILLFLLLIVTTGCGIKSNPVSIKQSATDYRMLIKNMEVVSSDDAVILKWNFQDVALVIDFIRIEKSEVGSAGNECKDCPRTFKNIFEIPVKGTIMDSRVSNPISYKDKEVVKGKTYNYRLILCDEEGVCQEVSKAEVNYQ